MISIFKHLVRNVNCFSHLVHCSGATPFIKGSSFLVLHTKKLLAGLHRISIRGIVNITDYNFNYFRSDVAYKSSAVQLHEDISRCVVSGSEFEYYFEGDVKPDALLKYLRTRDNVMKLSASQVKDVMCFVANLNTECDSVVLKWLDEKCAVSVMKWPLDLTLYVLDAWCLILGHGAFKKHYFQAVVSVLTRKVRSLTKNNVIQLLYFIGMSKLPPPFLMPCLEAKLELLRSQISDVEWAIACVSFFKTSTKIKSELVLSKACEVAKNFMKTDERFHLISVLKSLRQARYYNEDLNEMLKKYVADNHIEFNFVECSNFLASFAAQNVYCSETFNHIEQHCVNLIFKDEKLSGTIEITPTTHPAVHFRVKDLARLLWSMVTVGHCPQAATVEAVLNCIRQRLDSGEYRRQPHILVDTLHSLAVVECYPQDLLTKVLCSRFLEHLWKMGLDKPNYQYYFLYKSAEIESPKSIVDRTLNKKVARLLYPIPKSVNKEKNERAGFNELEVLLEKHLKDVKNFECCFVIPHIVIAGFHVKHCKSVGTDFSLQTERLEEVISESSENSEAWVGNSEILDSVKSDETVSCCIEILDETMCVRNTTQPVGLMKAKVRQLKKLSYDVVELTPSEISEAASLPSSEAVKKIMLWLN